MSVAITGRYLGKLRVSMQHESGAEITTVAPKDNNGDGSLFSPTDLCAASVGTCMLTVMAIVAERSGLSLDGSRFELTKEMVANPRRIGKVAVIMHLPATLSEDDRKKLEHTAHTCPVHRSLGSEVNVSVSFLYDA